MLRRAASSPTGCAAWLRYLPRRPVTPVRTLAQRHPDAFPRFRPPAPLPHLGDAGARGYARMARRIPPARTDGYSTSDGEADEPDAYREEEDLADEDAEEGAAEGKEWEGYMLDFGSGSDEDGDDDEEDEDAPEEGEKKQ